MRHGFDSEHFVDHVLTKDVSCRICDRKLIAGDHVLIRTWCIGASCHACGWWKLEEIEYRECFVVAIGRGARLMTDALARELKAMRIVTLNEDTHKMEWTESGRRLREAYSNKQSRVA